MTLMMLPLTPSCDSQILAISAIVLLPEEELSDVVALSSDCPAARFARSSAALSRTPFHCGAAFPGARRW